MEAKKKMNELISNQTNMKKNESKHLLSMKEKELNQKLLKKFRTKDMLIVTKRKHKIHQKQKMNEEREWKLFELIEKSQPVIKTKSDPQRLHKMTHSTKKRIEINKKERNNNIENDKKINKYKSNLTTFQEQPLRSVPSWRRGL